MAPPNTAEVFWAKTREIGSCVVWTGQVNGGGYGRLAWRGKMVLAHRLAFFLRLGRWPDGETRHLCNNPPCVLHAVEGSHSENIWDQVRAGTHHHVAKTHCPRGHPYDEANTYTDSARRRHCRECKRTNRRRPTTQVVK